jgi:RecB family exonuclease
MAGLPVRLDREALQKQYYARVLERSRKSVIVHVAGESTLPSRFIYELGLKEGKEVTIDPDMLYPEKRETDIKNSNGDPVVKVFDADKILWSSTMLKVWLSCRRRFYYRYIEKLQEKRDDGLNEGEFLHAALKKLFDGGKSFDNEDKLLEKLKSIMADMLGEESAQNRYLKELWSEHLAGFATAQVRHFAEGWRVEQCEMPIEGVVCGLRFRGVVDRIDKRGDETMILDYKSGSVADANRTRKLERLDDFQMSIYHHILSRRYSSPQLYFIKLFENGVFVPYNALEEKSAVLEEHLRKLRETKSFEALKCEDLNRCRYCPYTLICERGEYL